MKFTESTFLTCISQELLEAPPFSEMNLQLRHFLPSSPVAGRAASCPAATALVPEQWSYSPPLTLSSLAAFLTKPLLPHYCNLTRNPCPLHLTCLCSTCKPGYILACLGLTPARPSSTLIQIRAAQNLSSILYTSPQCTQLPHTQTCI